MSIIEVETWNVTELNTRKNVFADDIQDILYGDAYPEHKFETREQAEKFEAQLNAHGIKTNITHVFRQTKVEA